MTPELSYAVEQRLADTGAWVAIAFFASASDSCEYLMRKYSARRMAPVLRVRDTRLDAPNVEVPTSSLDADAVRAIVADAIGKHARENDDSFMRLIRTCSTLTNEQTVRHIVQQEFRKVLDFTKLMDFLP